jgi:hypothetical protein
LQPRQTPNSGTLKLMPSWHPLHGDLRFEKIVAWPKSSALAT